jgi:hypothetical protein
MIWRKTPGASRRHALLYFTTAPHRQLTFLPTLHLRIFRLRHYLRQNIYFLLALSEKPISHAGPTKNSQKNQIFQDLSRRAAYTAAGLEVKDDKSVTRSPHYYSCLPPIHLFSVSSEAPCEKRIWGGFRVILSYTLHLGPWTLHPFFIPHLTTFRNPLRKYIPQIFLAIFPHPP